MMAIQKLWIQFDYRKLVRQTAVAMVTLNIANVCVSVHCMMKEMMT